MRLFIFLLLGSQVDFALMSQYLVGGVVVVAVFMLVARPLTVFLCALPDRRAKWSFGEVLFMCWTRETGSFRGRSRAFWSAWARRAPESSRQSPSSRS